MGAPPLTRCPKCSTRVTVVMVPTDELDEHNATEHPPAPAGTHNLRPAHRGK